MKLTVSDRDAFVNAVMHDVPNIDYESQIAAEYNKAVSAALEPKLRAVFDDPKLRGCLARHHVNAGDDHSMYMASGLRLNIKDKKVIAAIGTLKEKRKAQEAAHRELRSKVAAAISACNTLKQAQERLPEFLKYLPADRDAPGANNLPVVANVVAELTKAGWPKSR